MYIYIYTVNIIESQYPIITVTKFNIYVYHTIIIACQDKYLEETLKDEQRNHRRRSRFAETTWYE